MLDLWPQGHGFLSHILGLNNFLILNLFVWFDSLSPSHIIFSHVGTVFLGQTSTKQWIKCLAQGHHTVTPPEVRLKLATLQSPVYRSTN